MPGFNEVTRRTHLLALAVLALCWPLLTTAVASDLVRPNPPVLSLEGGAAATSGWQLPEGHWVPAKMPMTLVHPRPDNETNDWARHRRAYPGLEYRVPVTVQGGAFPFRYELVEGPRGMAIGGRVNGADYGVLSWTPEEEAGVYPVRVRVTDQELNQVIASFEVTVTREGFIFLDSSAPGNGDGTIDSPLNSFAAVHRNDVNDRTYEGHILYLRGGQHVLTGPENSNGNFRIDGVNKPLVWLGYPGEEATVNASTTVVNMLGSGSGQDVFMQGFQLAHSSTIVPNSRFFFFGSSAGQRMTFFELDFYGLVPGTSGTDNPGAIVAFAGSNYRDYLTVQDCYFEEYSAPANTGVIGSFYTTRYAVIDRNTFGPTSSETPARGIFPKGQNDYWSIRQNESVFTDFRYGAVQQYMGSRGLGPQRIEIAYNLIRASARDRGSVSYNWSNGVSGDNHTYVYRNTLVGRVRGLRGEHTLHIERNVVLTDDDPAFGDQDGGRTIIDEGNLVRSFNDSTALDERGQLKGEYRKHFGVIGHEIGQ